MRSGNLLTWSLGSTLPVKNHCVLLLSVSSLKWNIGYDDYYGPFQVRDYGTHGNCIHSKDTAVQTTIGRLCVPGKCADSHMVDILPHTPNQIRSRGRNYPTPYPLLKPMILLTKPLSKPCTFLVGYFCYFKCIKHRFTFLNLISKKIQYEIIINNYYHSTNTC